MAHTKAGGSTRQKGNRTGKRLGVKIFGGQTVSPGNIIIRQKGSKFLPGVGTRMSRDYSIYAIVTGIVQFITRRGRQVITVLTK